MLYCTVLYHTVLYCTMLYRTVMYCNILYHIVMYCIVLYCTMLYRIKLYHIMLYSTVLYRNVLYHNVLYCTVLFCVLLLCHTVPPCPVPCLAVSTCPVSCLAVPSCPVSCITCLLGLAAVLSCAGALYKLQARWPSAVSPHFPMPGVDWAGPGSDVGRLVYSTYVEQVWAYVIVHTCLCTAPTCSRAAYF